MNYIFCASSTQALQDRIENPRIKPTTGFGEGCWVMPRCFKCGGGPIYRNGSGAVCSCCNATITKQEIEERNIDFERIGEMPL